MNTTGHAPHEPTQDELFARNVFNTTMLGAVAFLFACFASGALI